MTGIRPPPRRGTRPCGLLLPASQAIGCDHRVGKGVRRVFAHAPREASAIGQYLATLGPSAFDWRRQFGPALDQTIFGLERHDPLVMSGAAAISCLGCDRRRARAGARRGPWSIPCSCFGMSRVSVSFRRAAAVEGRPRAALESQPATTTGSKLASCGPHSAWRDATMAYASQFRYSDRRRSPAFTPERLRRFHHVKSAAAAPVAARPWC